VVVRYGYLDRPDHGAGFVDELVAVTVQHILDRWGGTAVVTFDCGFCL
jgi:hypothetical protein